jgi:TonB-linked SusC/RagA family outer membrane protein
MMKFNKLVSLAGLSLLPMLRPEISQLHAQTVALAENSFSGGIQENAQARSLAGILEEIKTRFNISIVYETQYVKGRTIQMPVGLNGTVEQVLDKILPQVNLRYKKIDASTYIIVVDQHRSPQAIHEIESRLPDPVRLQMPGQLTNTSAVSLHQMQEHTRKMDITIQGKISSENGEGLPGVNVIIKGTTLGTTTDRNGNYFISVPDAHVNGTLVFSFIGYVTQEVSINNQSVINVTLLADIKSLKEVVVIGYGTQERRNVTGAISSVKAVEIQKSVVPTFESALQGRIPGLLITQASGVPGGLVTVRLRGVTSINGASEPLYVVDGIPINSGGRGDAGGGISGNAGASNNLLSDLNPNDIESVEVLKDASAAAIYGARGGAGVILITTKRGKAGKTQFNAGYSQGITMETNRVDVLNAPQYLQLFDEAVQNSGSPANAVLPVRPGFSREVAEATNSDHLSTVLRQGMRQEANLSASGGSEKTTFYVGGTYYKEKGIIVGNDFDRLSGRFSIDNQATDRIKFGASMGITYTTDYRVGTGTNTDAGGFGLAQTLLPIFPYYNADGTYFDPYNGGLGQSGRVGRNLIAMQNRANYSNYQTKMRTLGGAYAEVTLLPGLSFRSDIGIDIFNQTINSYYSRYVRTTSGSATVPVKPNGVAGTPGAQARMERVLLNNWNTNNTLTYTRKLNQHEFTVLGGLSFNKNNSPYLGVQGEVFPNDFFRDPSQATYKISPNGSNSDRYAFLAYFGRVLYNLNNKYLASVSFRREGSSRFGEDNKLGNFPAVSVGWVLSEENFLKNNSVVSFLKLRASYGQTGNAAGIQNNQPYGLWKNAQSDNLGAYKGNPYMFSEQVANPDLHWEKQNQLDIGLEYGVLNGRISGTIDFYDKVSKEMLLNFPGPATQGQENNDIVLNAGKLQNRGVEFSISTQNLVGAFRWSTDFNISHNRNEVLDVAGIQPTSLSGGSNVATFEGRPLGSFYLVKWAGVDAATGEEMVYDSNGEARLASAMTSSDMQTARVGIFDKPALPKAFGGLTNTFAYRGFDATVLFTFSLGNWIYDDGERTLSYFRGNDNNLRKEALNRWTEDKPNTSFPKLYYPATGVTDPTTVIRNTATTRFLHNASFGRLKTLQVGYTIPSAISQKVHIRTFRIYATAQNLLTFTKFPGWDPEIVRDLGGLDNAGVQARNLGQGFTNLDLPQLRTFVVGVNVGF